MTALTSAERVLLAETEDALLSYVLAAAKLYGWRVFHARPARTADSWRTAVQGDGAGWPDIVAVRGSRCVVAELKREKGTCTPAQTAWLDAFDAAGIESYVWRPSMKAEILRVLA